MKYRNHLVGFVAGLFLTVPVGINAQAGRGQAVPPPSPKAAEPLDLTGYWVSIVNEDWLHRMGMAKKGNYIFPERGSAPTLVPLNPEGLKVTNSWDPVKDEVEGNQCKAYGAAGIMRMPGRLNITWEGENVLKIDASAGSQTRKLYFGQAPPVGAGTWQGTSVAQWERPPGRGTKGGSLKVTTKEMKPGYYFRSGAPYSENAVMTEYFTRINEANGDQYLMLTAFVEDPKYLTGPFIRTLFFKREPDASKWFTTPCSPR